MLLRALKDLPTSVNPIRAGDQFIEQNDEQALDWIRSGYAEQFIPESRKVSPPLPAPAVKAVEEPLRFPAWHGCTAVVIASGPSLSEEQCRLVADWRSARGDARVAVINTSFRRAPFADLLYACDGPWWRAVDPETKKRYYDEARETFAPEALWTQDEGAAKEFGLNFIASRRTSNLSRDPSYIAQGANSALQLMNLLYLAGVRRMLTLGIDLKGKHWHPDHPSPLSNSLPHKAWRENFGIFAADLSAEGVEVINCSTDSALHAFPRGDLAEELAK
jgi:hypothetical protein